MAQASAALTNWILTRPPVRRALDYGCGKLRYAPYLARQCSQLGLVDSNVQLDRSQVIAGRRTTVKRYAQRHWPSCRIYAIEEFWHGIEEKYDFVLCSNVLSAIPSYHLRNRSLKAIMSCLRQKGECLFVNQYTNSEFHKARNRPEAIDHLDGWILASQKSASYYGILDRAKTIRILRAIGFRILEAWIDGQSAFVLVGCG
ncbi:MAG: methyltransferase domain-containing protein [Nitrospirae bacterium]|nr:methyltransferase domain-containing protein [Nitrospirota bacterium]MBI3351355.1 methyltransferase domain-containing protein [Nitrospirota bacterium]